MYSTQSLLCPARPSGLKSQGHLVPPTKKKKQPRTPPAIRTTKVGFFWRRNCFQETTCKNRSASHSRVPQSACAHRCEHAFVGSQRPPAPEGRANSSAGKTEKGLQANPAREGTQGQSDDTIFPHTPGLLFNVKTSPWGV